MLRGKSVLLWWSSRKNILDKITTFKEKIETQGAGKETERKLNPRDIREWLSSIPNEHLFSSVWTRQIDLNGLS